MLQVPEHGCRAHKPKTEEECNTMECPSWHTTPWSGVSFPNIYILYNIHSFSIER